ncbi:NAD(P)/FAD-dependent oxidoreductase [Nibricoccus sp. IMCC34717]|uniref:NAD(P)/FAD-dependent oxidoreductase n=1 Tax=Nibricoccus sp. IMCC34717 TaxID=3034021 RepID=UPI0038506B82
MTKIAIVGSGIAGLGCAHFLHRHFDVHVFEQDRHVGGHSNTVEVIEPGTGRACPLDTGFMVYNEVTYPELTKLFTRLKAPVKRTDMSFSVRHVDTGIEFNGHSLNHIFAQRRNLWNLRFWKMLMAIRRFNSEAVASIDDPETREITLGEYVRRRGYGEDFFNLYLVPMSSAVWSTPPEQMLSFPASTLLRFFHNHGFLGLNTQHQWWTVDGGSREYVKLLTAPFRDRIRTGRKVSRVLRSHANAGVTLITDDGATESFDKVILACHADQALRLLVNPTADEGRLLGEFHYQKNTATVHSDTSVMPRAPLAWAAWNYEINRSPEGQVSTATHYYMNRLQGVSDRQHFFVTINRPEAIDPAKVIRRIEYEHPLFSLGAAHAQIELPSLNMLSPQQSTYFCGSYFRYGFHEDAFASAVKLSSVILGRDPWNA